MDTLALVIGALVAVWYFGGVESVRRLFSAGNGQAVRLEVKSWQQAENAVAAADLEKIKEFKDKMAGF